MQVTVTNVSQYENVAMCTSESNCGGLKITNELDDYTNGEDVYRMGYTHAVLRLRSLFRQNLKSVLDRYLGELIVPEGDLFKHQKVLMMKWSHSIEAMPDYEKEESRASNYCSFCDREHHLSNLLFISMLMTLTNELTYEIHKAVMYLSWTEKEELGIGRNATIRNRPAIQLIHILPKTPNAEFVYESLRGRILRFTAMLYSTFGSPNARVGNIFYGTQLNNGENRAFPFIGMVFRYIVEFDYKKDLNNAIRNIDILYDYLMNGGVFSLKNHHLPALHIQDHLFANFNLIDSNFLTFITQSNSFELKLFHRDLTYASDRFLVNLLSTEAYIYLPNDRPSITHVDQPIIFGLNLTISFLTIIKHLMIFAFHEKFLQQDQPLLVIFDFKPQHFILPLTVFNSDHIVFAPDQKIKTPFAKGSILPPDQRPHVKLDNIKRRPVKLTKLSFDSDSESDDDIPSTMNDAYRTPL